MYIVSCIQCAPINLDYNIEDAYSLLAKHPLQGKVHFFSMLYQIARYEFRTFTQLCDLIDPKRRKSPDFISYHSNYANPSKVDRDELRHNYIIKTILDEINRDYSEELFIPIAEYLYDNYHVFTDIYDKEMELISSASEYKPYFKNSIVLFNDNDEYMGHIYQEQDYYPKTASLIGIRTSLLNLMRKYFNLKASPVVLPLISAAKEITFGYDYIQLDSPIGSMIDKAIKLGFDQYHDFILDKEKTLPHCDFTVKIL